MNELTYSPAEELYYLELPMVEVNYAVMRLLGGGFNPEQ